MKWHTFNGNKPMRDDDDVHKIITLSMHVRENKVNQSLLFQRLFLKNWKWDQFTSCQFFFHEYLSKGQQLIKMNNVYQ